MLPEFEYEIANSAGESVALAIHVDEHTRQLLVDDEYVPPDWARLEFRQCAHCTLSASAHQYCPVARNMACYFARLHLKDSWEPVTLTVRSSGRNYCAETTAQRALGSLFGLISSLSPCPHTLPFRTMSLFHLPLASDTETLVRAASLFLLKSYLDVHRHVASEVSLDAMIAAYRNLKQLNRCFVKRFQDCAASDANINAMIMLDVLARDVDTGLEEKLVSLEKYFYFPESNYVAESERTVVENGISENLSGLRQGLS